MVLQKLLGDPTMVIRVILSNNWLLLLKVAQTFVCIAFPHSFRVVQKASVKARATGRNET